MTQSAASMMGASDKAYSTSCPPLDDLLGGGLKRGSVLEISGPPGCGKERVAVEAIKSFVASGKGVLFVGMYSDSWELPAIPTEFSARRGCAQTCRIWFRPPPSCEPCWERTWTRVWVSAPRIVCSP